MTQGLKFKTLAKGISSDALDSVVQRSISKQLTHKEKTMLKAEAHLVEIRQTAQIIASLMARNLGREWTDLDDSLGEPLRFTSDFEGGDSLWIERWNPDGDSWGNPVAISGPDWVPTATSLELVDKWTSLLLGGLFQRWLAEERRLARFRASQLKQIDRLKDRLVGATIKLHPCYEPLPNK